MIELRRNNWYNHYMDEREQRIVQTYQDFKELGVIEDEEDSTLEPEAAHSTLVQVVADYEKDIAVAYEKNKSQQTTHLTKAAQLGLMIEGGTDEQIREFVIENGLSMRQSVEQRREEAIKAIKTVREKAEKARKIAVRESELSINDEDHRSLDDTLVHILNRGAINPTDQGSMRLLFGYVSISDPRVTPDLVTRLKSNAAGILRQKLVNTKENLADSPRAKEGEGILYRMVTSSRMGYPTIQSIAETIAYDKESHTKAVYTDDVEQNKRMIETYVSSALDIMYPEEQKRTK